MVESTPCVVYGTSYRYQWRGEVWVGEIIGVGGGQGRGRESEGEIHLKF